MRFGILSKFAALALAAGAMASAPAQATLVSGAITGGNVFGTGSVVTLGAADTPFAVGADNFNTDNLYVFNEVQNFALLSDLSVILNGVQKTLTTGTVISSHFIVFDPLIERTVRATLTFDGTILGIARSDAQLAASNHLGLPGVTYNVPAGFGLEPGLDTVTASTDTVAMRLGGSTPGDTLRVLTVGNRTTGAVPEPTTWAMLLIGFAATGAMIRGRKTVFAAA